MQKPSSLRCKGKVFENVVTGNNSWRVLSLRIEKFVCSYVLEEWKEGGWRMVGGKED